MTESALTLPSSTAMTIGSMPRHSAWRLASFWLGAIGIVATVLFVAQPALGLAAAGTAAIAMGYAVIGSTTWSARRAWPHAIAALIAGIAALGMCATQCGTYAGYDEFLGLPTPVAAIGLHGLVAIIVFTTSAAESATDTAAGGLVADLAIAVAIGGSLFFGSLLLAAGTWCGACTAIHALMVVQALELVVHRRGIALIACLSTAVASAGAANAVYHHRLVPAIQNDPDALLVYLRSTWMHADPPARLVPASDDLDPVRRAGQDIQRQLHLQATAETPPGATPVHHETTPRTPSVAAPLRALADANRWGKPTAPVTLVVAIDTGCPVCAQQFRQLLELQDLVAAGRMQVRFLITYKNDASQATASIAYVAGMLGDQQLVQTLQSIYAHFNEILTAADALAVLPPGMTSHQVVDILRHYQGDVTTLLSDAAVNRERLGATGDPAMWLLTADSPKPLRTFNGLTMSTILRLAANSLDPAAAGP